MSKQDLEAGATYFQITKENAPKTYKIFMEFPVEVMECWTNLLEGKALDHNFESSVSPILHDPLIRKIGHAFVADGAAVRDESTPSGLRAIRDYLRAEQLDKLDKINTIAANAAYIAKLAKKNGVKNVTGSQITTNKVPKDLAKKVNGLLTEAASLLLNADRHEEGEDLCHIKLAVLMLTESGEEK